MYQPPRFMSVGTAVEQLLEIEERLQLGACSPERTAVGLARVGSLGQKIAAGESRQFSGSLCCSSMSA